MMPLELITNLAPVGWALLIDTLLRLITRQAMNYAQRPSLAYQPRLLLSAGAPSYDGDENYHHHLQDTTLATPSFTPHTMFPSSFDFVSNTDLAEIDDNTAICFADISSSLESDASDNYLHNDNREDVTVPEQRPVIEELPEARGNNDDEEPISETAPRLSRPDNMASTPNAQATSSRAGIVLYASQRISFCPLAAMIIYYGWTVIAYFVLVIPTIVFKWALDNSCFLDLRATLPFEEKLLWLFLRLSRYITMARWVFLLRTPVRGRGSNGMRLPYNNRPLQPVDSCGTAARSRAPIILVSHVDEVAMSIIFDPDDQRTRPSAFDDHKHRLSWSQDDNKTGTFRFSSSSKVDSRASTTKAGPDLAALTNLSGLCSRDHVPSSVGSCHEDGKVNQKSDCTSTIDNAGGGSLDDHLSRSSCELATCDEPAGMSDINPKAPICHAPVDGPNDPLPITEDLIAVVGCMNWGSEASQMDEYPDTTSSSAHSQGPAKQTELILTIETSTREVQNQLKSPSALAEVAVPLCEDGKAKKNHEPAVDQLGYKDADDEASLRSLDNTVMGSKASALLPQLDSSEPIPITSGLEAAPALIKSVRFVIPDEPGVPCPMEIETPLQDDLERAPNSVDRGHGSEKQNEPKVRQESLFANPDTTVVLVSTLSVEEADLAAMTPDLSTVDESDDEGTADHDGMLPMDTSTSYAPVEGSTGTEKLDSTAGSSVTMAEVALTITPTSSCLSFMEEPLVKLPNVEFATPDGHVLEAAVTSVWPTPIEDTITRSPAQVGPLVLESAVVINIPGCITEPTHVHEPQQLAESTGVFDASATSYEAVEAEIQSVESSLEQSSLFTYSNQLASGNEDKDDKDAGSRAYADHIDGDDDSDATSLLTVEPSEETATVSLSLEEDSSTGTPGLIDECHVIQTKVEDTAVKEVEPPIVDADMSLEDTCTKADPPRVGAGVAEYVEEITTISRDNGRTGTDSSRIDVEIVEQSAMSTLGQDASLGCICSEVSPSHHGPVKEVGRPIVVPGASTDPPRVDVSVVEENEESTIRKPCSGDAHMAAIPSKIDINAVIQSAKTATVGVLVQPQHTKPVQVDAPRYDIFDLPIAEENVAPRERLLLASMHAPVRTRAISTFVPNIMQSAEPLHYQPHRLPTTNQPWPILRLDSSKSDQGVGVVNDLNPRHISASIHAPRTISETAPQRLDSAQDCYLQIPNRAHPSDMKSTRNEFGDRFVEGMDENPLTITLHPILHHDLRAPNWANVGAGLFHALRRGVSYEAPKSALAPSDRIIRKPPKAVIDSKASATNLLDSTSVIAPSASVVGPFGESCMQSCNIQRDRGVVSMPTNNGNIGARGSAWAWFGSPTRNDRTTEKHAQEIFSPAGIRQLFPTNLPKYGGTLYKARSTASLVDSDFSSNNFMATCPTKQTPDSIPHTAAGRWKARLAGGLFDRELA